MKTLQQIKDEVAREQGYLNWEDYADYRYLDDTILDDIAKRYAMEKAKSAVMDTMKVC